MNKHLIIRMFLISIIIMVLMTAIASALTLTILTKEEFAKATKMKDTTIEYTSYREIVVNDPGVIYLIKITNTGKDNKTYEIIPDASVIRNIGTYRIDPSDTAILRPNEEGTFYIYLSVEKPVNGRTVIPVSIKSGSTGTTIELVARSIGPFMPEKQKASTGALNSAFKVVLSILLIIIIILALIFGFRKIGKRKNKYEEGEEEKPELTEDVETYY
jgi:flagellar basal body-associated protein FliL